MAKLHRVPKPGDLILLATQKMPETDDSGQLKRSGKELTANFYATVGTVLRLDHDRSAFLVTVNSCHMETQNHNAYTENVERCWVEDTYGEKAWRLADVTSTLESPASQKPL